MKRKFWLPVRGVPGVIFGRGDVAGLYF
jgi:hypothetical protein